MIPPRRLPPEDNVDSWLMSYADMITLLLCFFIIFVSVSEPKKDRLSEITDGLSGQFGSVDLATPFKGVLGVLQGIVEDHALYRDVAITPTDKGLEMELATKTFYKQDSAEFADDKLPALTELIKALNGLSFMEYRVAIEAHTSDVPVRTPQFPSNWELSAARAARMVRFFIQQGTAPDRLKAVGYGDSRPKVPNRDINGNVITENRDKNQRIVIKLERITR